MIPFHDTLPPPSLLSKEVRAVMAHAHAARHAYHPSSHPNLVRSSYLDCLTQPRSVFSRLERSKFGLTAGLRLSLNITNNTCVAISPNSDTDLFDHQAFLVQCVLISSIGGAEGGTK